MKLNKTIASALMLVGATNLLTPTVYAAESDGGFTFEAEATGIYDSNVSVEQIDVLVRDGDTKLKMKAALGFENSFSEDGEFDVKYKISQSLYSEYTNYNIQSHTLSTGIKNKFSGVTLAADYSFVHTRLGGDSFLDMNIISPSIAGFAAKNIYLRAGYNFYDKDFKTSDTRDAKNHNLTIDGYYFFNKSKSFFSVGASYEDENALADEFDLKGYTLRTSLQLPVEIANEGGKVKFSYAYRDRDYDNITPSIAAIRAETRSVFKASLSVPVYDKFSLIGEYKYTDRNSNFENSNYTENVVTIGVGYEF